MRARTRGKWSGPGSWSSWRRALLISSALHALALLAIGFGATSRRHDPATDGRGMLGFSPDLLEPSTVIDLATAAAVLPAVEVVPIVPEAPLVDVAPALDGDRTDLLPNPTARPKEGFPDRRAPAPDRGAGTGMVLADRPWRRDASSLHERLTDGAELNQPSHARTAPRAVSPQAVRRERAVGIGDSARSARYRPAPPVAQYGLPDPEVPGAGSETVAGGAGEPAQPPRMPPVEDPSPRVADTTRGPLDSDEGSRSFDVEARGPVAMDDRAARAASNESHPSITDLTAASMSGNSREGRGTSDTPGAVVAISPGKAPAIAGAHGASTGTDEEARTRERIYNRYMREIGARVNDALIWPRALAIRLEQGETVVRFVVLPDGKVSDNNIRVVKSSGFTEFDQAALDAVRKASPFPPMREGERARPVPVTMPVNFSNPVIR